MDYFVYLLKYSDGSFYCGIAKDLDKRLKQHNGILKGGSTYTRSRRPVKLIYFEKYKTRSDALKREYEIKKLSHKKKSSLT